jgi:hypothetical protein
MAMAKDWLEMAEENAKSGDQLLNRERMRAATSRFYYAAFQAAHATLFTTPLKASIPVKGNWDHGPLANALKDGAVRHLGFNAVASEQLRKRLVGAMHARVVADYGAGATLQQSSIDAAQKAARQLIALAHRNGAAGK